MSRVFDESKHPRDELGRFTEVAKSKAVYDPKTKTFAQNTSYKDILQWDREKQLRKAEYIYNSDFPPDDLFRLRLDFFGKDYPKLTIEDLPKELYGFADFDRLYTSHHQRHAADMGYKNQKEYQKGAIDFLKYEKGQIYGCDFDRYFYKYNEKTKRLCTFDKDGIIKTYMPLSNKEFERRCKENCMKSNKRHPIVTCTICGLKYDLDGDMAFVCPYCLWMNEFDCETEEEYNSANHMNQREAREQYAKGLTIFGDPLPKVRPQDETE